MRARTLCSYFLPVSLAFSRGCRFCRTWVLSTEPLLEPPELLKKACDAGGVGENEFIVPGLGETVLF